MTKASTIAIQGGRGSFHDIAVRKYFEEPAILECGTFKELCQALESGKVDRAVMAIENTIGGTILTNHALIREHHLRITGEVYLHIRMDLLALPGVKRSDIRTVCSHPMALKQCAEHLASMGDISVVEENDTAMTAERIAREALKDTATIASPSAGALYGLQPLATEIETNKLNFTRFLVLSAREEVGPEANKASLCFELGHYPGSLADILNIFRDHRINMTKIQSVPVLGKPYEYAFHVDVEWEDRQDYDSALGKVLRSASNLSVLGEYPKGIFDPNANDHETESIHATE